jgi:hypothetical protein
MPVKKKAAPAKGKEKKVKEKSYTYEEYCKAFCSSSESDLMAADPKSFGLQLAKEALKKVEHNPQQR